MVVDTGRVSLHLQKYMRNWLKYYSVKLAFFEATNLEPPLWVTQQEYVIYKTYENWRQLKKSWSTTFVGWDSFFFEVVGGYDKAGATRVEISVAPTLLSS
jgi:hypothetical protein